MTTKKRGRGRPKGAPNKPKMELITEKKELFKKFLFLAAFMLSAGIYAQNVTGIVTSDDGPLPGATVLVKGTNSFATTDFE